MGLTKNEQTLNNNNMNYDNITRCPDCNLISSLNLYYKEGKPSINYYCENNHKGNILLEDYMKKYNNYSILKEKCQDCNKNQNEIKVEFLYCTKCNKLHDFFKRIGSDLGGKVFSSPMRISTVNLLFHICIGG